ncbi:MAG: HAD-IA family hydrolase [Hyphomicrobiales bacterium]|nr:HAD-IA family hydrolase [Hyphomicrobiales bacterium]
MTAEAQALVLDFGGVISKTVFETHAESEKALGLPSGSLTWRGPFDPGGDPLWRAMQADRITERDYWLSRAKETGALVGRCWDTMAEFIRAIRGADPAAIIRPEAKTVIAAARAAGRKLAILSNELDLFYGADLRQKLSLLSDFDLIVDATYTNILKPDPEAYRLVTEGLRLPAEACVFVDDQQRNVRGAEAVGMRTVAFDVTDPETSFRQVSRLLNLQM